VSVSVLLCLSYCPDSPGDRFIPGLSLFGAAGGWQGRYRSSGARANGSRRAWELSASNEYYTRDWVKNQPLPFDETRDPVSQYRCDSIEPGRVRLTPRGVDNVDSGQVPVSYETGTIPHTADLS